MKRTLFSLMLSVPMFAVAVEPTQTVEPALAVEPAQTTLVAEPDCVTPVPAVTTGTTAMATTEATAAVQDAPAALPCVDTTVAAPPAEPAYVPKTAHDNSPYRFDMNQNGKRMTADEFDAWMQAKGIRVATGVPGAHRSATQGTSAANPVTPGPDTRPTPPARDD